MISSTFSARSSPPSRLISSRSSSSSAPGSISAAATRWEGCWSPATGSAGSPTRSCAWPRDPARGGWPLVLEGGYDLEALKDGVREVLGRLARSLLPSSAPEAVPSAVTARELEPCFRTFRAFWEL